MCIHKDLVADYRIFKKYWFIIVPILVLGFGLMPGALYGVFNTRFTDFFLVLFGISISTLLISLIYVYIVIAGYCYSN
jgi:hypothetical protein